MIFFFFYIESSLEKKKIFIKYVKNVKPIDFIELVLRIAKTFKKIQGFDMSYIFFALEV